MREPRSMRFGAFGKRSRLAAGLIVVVLSSAGVIYAQTAGSATITGTVTDPAGAVVPGANVIVHNADTGTDRAVTTNEAGIYSAAFLQPGHYDLKIEKPGFATLERNGLTLEVGRTLTLDFSLEVRAGAETVTVTGEAPVLDTEKTEVSQEVSHNMVTNLPIIGRRWDNFVLLTPGVTTDGGLVSYREASQGYTTTTP